jgi:hypothetical protein
MKDPDEKVSAIKEASSGLGMLLMIAAAVLVIGALFYFGLGSSDVPAV